MDIPQLQQYLAFTNILLSIFLSFAIFKSKACGKNWLALQLLCFGLFSLLQLGYLTQNHIILVYMPVILFPAVSSFGITLHAYINKLLFNEDPKKIIRQLFIPIFISIIHIIMVIFFNDDFTPEKIKNLEGIQPVYAYIMIFFFAIYNSIFFVQVGIKVFTYQKEFKENYSNDMVRNAWWFTIFAILNLSIYIVIIGVVLFNFFSFGGIPFSIIEEMFLLAVILVYLYYLIIKPEILPIEYDAVDNKDSESAPKYQKMNLPDELRQNYARQLEKYMETEKAFTNENISVKTLAEELGIKQHHLSMTINIEFNMNFYNYINRHRIRYAESMLKDTKVSASVLEIAFNAGFQSKTSFNKAFKAITGMTPTQFRRSSAV